MSVASLSEVTKELVIVTEVKDELSESIGDQRSEWEFPGWKTSVVSLSEIKRASGSYRGERRAWRVYRRSKERVRVTEVKDECGESIGGQRSKREFPRWKTSVASLSEIKGARERYGGERRAWLSEVKGASESFEVKGECGESIGDQRSDREIRRWKKSVVNLSEVKGASESYRGERRAWRVYRRSKERARVFEVKDKRGESIGGQRSEREFPR